MELLSRSTTPDLIELFDPTDTVSRVLDELLVRHRTPLPDLSGVSPGPGYYAVFFRTLSSPEYELDADSYRRVGRGTYPVYLGSAKSLSTRTGEHIRNCRPVASIEGGHALHVAFVPTTAWEDALYAEQVLCRQLRPVWNTVVRGWGSAWQGRSRSSQSAPDWSVLHPGRMVGCGPVTTDAAALRTRVAAHLEQTVSLDLWSPLR